MIHGSHGVCPELGPELRPWDSHGILSGNDEQFAIENGPFMEDSPMKMIHNADFLYGYVKLPESTLRIDSLEWKPLSGCCQIIARWASYKMFNQVWKQGMTKKYSYLMLPRIFLLWLPSFHHFPPSRRAWKVSSSKSE